jgi:glycosyltransferase involved in cell wall biosynthesis
MMLVSKDSCEKNFLRRYEKIVLRLREWVLKAQDANSALDYANLYGEIRTFNHDGVYADNEVEQHIESLVTKTGSINTQALSAARGEGVLILATRLYDYGGHTKVLLTWLELMKDVLPHKLAITSSLTEHTQTHIRKLAVEIVKIPSSGLDTVAAILDAAKGFNRIVLMTHPQDIVSVVAARILAASGYQLIFYNHADHLFTFGIGAAHTVCEISAYGESINQRTKRVKGASVRLGVPLKRVDLTTMPLPEDMLSLEGCKVILSAGSSYKYKPDEAFIFADFIDRLLARRNDVKVVLVGPTGQEAWWKERRVRWNERVLFCGTLPQSEYMKVLKLADIYVDSYPVTGGTAFPEALLAGKACIGLITPVQGYTLADELKVDSTNELVLQAENILDRDPETMRHIENVRQRVAYSQRESTFKERISKIYKANLLGTGCGDSRSHKGLDNYWLEAKWRTSCIIYSPRKKTIAILPLSRMIWLVMALMLIKRPWTR